MITAGHAFPALQMNLSLFHSLSSLGRISIAHAQCWKAGQSQWWQNREREASRRAQPSAVPSPPLVSPAAGGCAGGGGGRWPGTESSPAAVGSRRAGSSAGMWGGAGMRGRCSGSGGGGGGGRLRRLATGEPGAAGLDLGDEDEPYCSCSSSSLQKRIQSFAVALAFPP